MPLKTVRTMIRKETDLCFLIEVERERWRICGWNHCLWGSDLAQRTKNS